MKANLLTTILTLLGLAVSVSAWSQSPQIFHNAVAGQVLAIGVISEPNRPVIRVAPRNGVARFQSSGGSVGAIGPDVLEFTSATLGVDTLVLEYWATLPNPHFVRTEYIITVAESIVDADDDYAGTTTGTSLTIPVLANDTATFGSLSLSAITIVNDGTASIVGDDIVFTPKPGFEGVASLQYVTCDLLGICDRATVVFTVSAAAPKTDTLSLQVEKNGSQVVLIDPQNFVLTTTPQHGTLSSTYPYRYTPNTNFTGTDLFEWTLFQGGTTFVKRVEVAVLNTAAPNRYAKDDQAFISKGTVAYIDVLANDLQGASLSGFGIASPPANGTVSIQNRRIVYTPNARFTGVDKFRYRVFPPGYSGPQEFATVSILVSDLPPASFEFVLETPKNTPLVLEYPIPLTNYSLGIVSPLPSYGQASFLPVADTTIGGYAINGERLIVYNPAPGFTGQDLVRVSYCITTTGVCIALNLRISVKDLAPPPGGWCVQGCVWPGDTDGNGRVEVADLLPIGRKHGMQGIVRGGTGNTWRGLAAADWQELDDRMDLKYVDADGNGLISASDTAVILSNIGRYHSPYAAPAPPLRQLPFVLTFPFDTIYAGELYAIDISLGTPSFYAQNVYGFTLGFNFNPNFVAPGSQELIHDNDAWVSYGTAPLDIVHEPAFGAVQTAFTRTDGRPVTGYGRVGRFYFTGVEDILGIRPHLVTSPTLDDELDPTAEVVGYADFEIADPTVSIDGVNYGAEGGQLSVPVAVRPKNLGLRDRDLVVYPNPARAGSQTRLHLNGATAMGEIRIVSELGRVVARYQSDTNDFYLPTGDFTSGVYTVEIEEAGHTVRQRLVVQ